MTHPARAPSAALSPNASVRMLAVLMPTSMAASGFEEHARMAFPVSVYFRKPCSRTTTTLS